jgi:hypothetical protein
MRRKYSAGESLPSADIEISKAWRGVSTLVARDTRERPSSQNLVHFWRETGISPYRFHVSGRIVFDPRMQRGRDPGMSSTHHITRISGKRLCGPRDPAAKALGKIGEFVTKPRESGGIFEPRKR